MRNLKKDCGKLFGFNPWWGKQLPFQLGPGGETQAMVGRAGLPKARLCGPPSLHTACLTTETSTLSSSQERESRLGVPPPSQDVWLCNNAEQLVGTGE